MSKFCSNCGYQMDDSAFACPQCGTRCLNAPVSNADAAQPFRAEPVPGADVSATMPLEPNDGATTPVYYGSNGAQNRAPYSAQNRAPYGAPNNAPNATAKGGNDFLNKLSAGFSGAAAKIGSFVKADPNNKTATIIVAAVAVLLVLLIGGSVVSKHTGVNGAVRKIMSSYKKDDSDEFGEKMAEMVADAVKGDGEISISDDLLESGYASLREGDENYFDNNIDSEHKISYKVKSKTKLSNSKVKKLISDKDKAADFYGKMWKVKVKVTAKAKRGDDSESLNKYIYLIKESGKWKLYSMTSYEL